MSILPGVWLGDWPCTFATTSSMRSFRPLTLFGGDGTTAIEVLAIVVHPAKQGSFTLANVYSRGCSIQALRSLESSLRSCSRHHKFLFTGDFNAHHPAWVGPRAASLERMSVPGWMSRDWLYSMTALQPGSTVEALPASTSP